MHEFLYDMTLCTVAAWVLAVFAHLIRQPVILAYMVGGFMLGPAGFAAIKSQDSITAISELGLIFLLFMIGLEIDLKKIARSGSTILVTAAAQIGGGCLLALALFLAMGLPLGGGRFDTFYLAFAAAQASAVIAVKLLYDKRELDTLPGRITLGILVLQDLSVILFLAIQPSLTDLRASVLLLSTLRVAALVATALLVARFVLPWVFHRIARLPELVLVGALAWCLALGQFAEMLHLSREMGALIAGVSLSTFPYALDVVAKVTSLRDFFVTLFFVGLGMTIPVPTGALLLFAAEISAFVVISRFVTIVPVLYWLRRGLRASLLPAINLTQLSEFALVILTIGVAAGQVGVDVKAATSIAFVMLAAINPFFVGRSDGIVRWMVPRLKKIGVHDLDVTATPDEPSDAHGARIMLLGFFRSASSLIADLEARQSPLLASIAVVDFNPVVFHTLKDRGIRVAYGDIAQRDTLVHVGAAAAEVLICTVPDSLLKGVTNVRLVRQLRAINPTAVIVAPAEMVSDVEALYAAGADYVTVSRFGDATELGGVLEAIESKMLAERRALLDTRLAGRREVLA